LTDPSSSRADHVRVSVVVVVRDDVHVSLVCVSVTNDSPPFNAADTDVDQPRREGAVTRSGRSACVKKRPACTSSNVSEAGTAERPVHKRWHTVDADSHDVNAAESMDQPCREGAVTRSRGSTNVSVAASVHTEKRSRWTEQEEQQVITTYHHIATHSLLIRHIFTVHLMPLQIL